MSCPPVQLASGVCLEATVTFTPTSNAPSRAAPEKKPIVVPAPIVRHPGSTGLVAGTASTGDQRRVQSNRKRGEGRDSPERTPPR
jgi:hypothetical protein